MKEYDYTKLDIVRIKIKLELMDIMQINYYGEDQKRTGGAFGAWGSFVALKRFL